jgi:aldehyde dehydrogenase (NAD+)
MLESPVIKEEVVVQIDEVFELQRAHRFVVARTTVKERKQKLRRLREALFSYQQDIRDAMYADFRKHQVEVDLSELYTTKDEINFAIRNLGRWLQPETVAKSLMLLGSSSYVHYEPKGVCLIISPWNFPVLLTLGPLVSAIAAGNCVIIKPSEYTPHTSAVLKRMVESLFPREEIALFEGDHQVGQALLEKPFNHIYFTGSPAVGRKVMAAAARHLTSVTLELGGKSPAIIDDTADIASAARRIAWGNCLNKGQICVAPDHVWVHEKAAPAFLEAFKKAVGEFYGEDVKESPYYARIVNDKHYSRLKNYIGDAVEKGATVYWGGETDDDEKYISPTLLGNVPEDALIAEEEIFGPILPFRTFRNLEEPIEYLRDKHHPLALYIYSSNKANIRKLIGETRAGTTAVNHNAVHYFQIRTPFGGFNESGIGKGKGHAGFVEFCNQRSIFRQGWPDMVPLIMPPYTGWKKWLSEKILRWL